MLGRVDGAAVLARGIIIEVRTRLSRRSIRAVRATKYRDYYGLSPNYHSKYKCKLPSGIPRADAYICIYIYKYIYVYIDMSQCRSSSL